MQFLSNIVRYNLAASIKCDENIAQCICILFEKIQIHCKYDVTICIRAILFSVLKYCINSRKSNIYLCTDLYGPLNETLVSNNSYLLLQYMYTCTYMKKIQEQEFWFGKQTAQQLTLIPFSNVLLCNKKFNFSYGRT